MCGNPDLTHNKNELLDKVQNIHLFASQIVFVNVLAGKIAAALRFDARPRHWFIHCLQRLG